MLSFRTIVLASGLLVLIGLLWSASGTNTDAQDKKKSNAKAGSKFEGKTIDLIVTDGKASYTGELTSDDPMVQNHYFKIFSIKLEAGKTYRLEHRDAGTDPEFDPLLFLEDPEGKGLAVDNDSAGGSNARILFKARTTGAYRLIATTAPPRQTGKFKIDIKPGTAEEEKEAHTSGLIASYSESTPAEQKKIAAELTRYFAAKGAGLTVSDARMVNELADQLDETNLELSKSILEGLIKTFSHAANPKLDRTTKILKSNLAHLGMIGHALAITGKTVEGKNFDLKNLKGKVVLVDFWATWCGPCVAEMPNIEKAFDKYHAKGFEVIGVSLDRDDATVTKFAAKQKMKWASINVADSDALADKYDVNSIPFPVLVDQQGNVVSIRARGDDLEAMLERLLGK